MLGADPVPWLHWQPVTALLAGTSTVSSSLPLQVPLRGEKKMSLCSFSTQRGWEVIKGAPAGATFIIYVSWILLRWSNLLHVLFFSRQKFHAISSYPNVENVIHRCYLVENDCKIV